MSDISEQYLIMLKTIPMFRPLIRGKGKRQVRPDKRSQNQMEKIKGTGGNQDKGQSQGITKIWDIYTVLLLMELQV